MTGNPAAPPDLNDPIRVIYLQLDQTDDESSYNDEEITWCWDRINETDIEYIRKTEYDLEISRLRTELKKRRP